jgi:hypothetical protein
MGECEYGKGGNKVEYYNYENDNFIPYKCPRNSLPDKHYCEFHDSGYAQTNPDDVMKSFYTLVDEAVQNTKPLLCIGFYLPSEVNLTSKEFKDRIYFSHTIFTKEADFLHATFTKRANFSDATFTKEADFFRATLRNEFSRICMITMSKVRCF